ncbi:unnamed protein product [Meganyctiphanes norvegica]|uniref:Uncharacterized protein n=1 Tax=Meganyctiphanes norvegica TaxID=48144 RepID=A0AAV2R2L0_MEGNR
MTLVAVLWNVTQMRLLQTFQMMALKGQCLYFYGIVMAKGVLFFWQTRCLRRTPRSTLEAETLALVEGAEASVYLANILTQITGRKSISVRCLVDNRSLYDSVYSTRQVDNKKLRMDVKAVKNMLVSGEINRVDWVEGSQQLADCLTKKYLCWFHAVWLSKNDTSRGSISNEEDSATI